MRGGALLVEHNPRGLEHKVFAVTKLRAPQRSDRILLLVHLVRRSVLLLDPQSRGPKLVQTGGGWTCEALLCRASAAERQRVRSGALF